MSDLVITAANVVGTTSSGVGGSNTADGVAGAAISAGEIAYLDKGTHTYKLCDADSTVDLSVAAGMALNSAAANQPIKIQKFGRITVGAGVVVGEIYVLSVNPGKICPSSDLAAHDYVTVVGIGVSATEIDIEIVVSEVSVS